MRYDDIKGTKPSRFWRVRSDSLSWNLNEGDLLVFDETNPSNIARIRPTTGADQRVQTVNDWGKDCMFRSDPNSNTHGIVEGRHSLEDGTGDLNFIINIQAAGTGETRATHIGELARSGGQLLDTGTWMADEGP